MEHKERKNMGRFKKEFLSKKLYNILSKNNIISFYHYNNINSKEWGLIKKNFSQCKPFQSLLVSNRNFFKDLNNLNQHFFSHYTKVGKNKVIQAKHSEKVSKLLSFKDSFNNSTFLPNSKLNLRKKELLQETFSKEPVNQLKDQSQFQTISKYLQGPTFVIGFQSSKQLLNCLDVLKENSKLYLLGIFVEQKILSYLDIQKLIQFKKIENIHPALKKEIYGDVLSVLPKKKDVWLLVQQTLFINFIKNLKLKIQMFFYMRKNISFFYLNPTQFYVFLVAHLHYQAISSENKNKIISV